MAYEVILSHGAENDLEDHCPIYLGGQTRCCYKSWHGNNRCDFRKLENFPRLGRVVPEFDEECLREIIHSPYRLIYEVNDVAERIEVIRVWHAARGKSGTWIEVNVSFQTLINPYFLVIPKLEQKFW